MEEDPIKGRQTKQWKMTLSTNHDLRVGLGHPKLDLLEGNGFDLKLFHRVKYIFPCCGKYG